MASYPTTLQQIGNAWPQLVQFIWNWTQQAAKLMEANGLHPETMSPEEFRNYARRITLG